MIKIRNLRNGTTTVSGLNAGDLRLLALAIESGAWHASNGHAERADAIDRLARALRTAVIYPGQIGDQNLENGTTVLSDLYAELPKDSVL